jgi:hypothetical protein
VSSGGRNYLPIGFLDKNVIANNKVYTVSDPSLLVFGFLCSRMHNAWTQSVSGRLKSDIQYSTGIVYNNFPWPEDVTGAQTAAIERLAQAVLDAREQFPGSTLADLYDPLTMPPVLARAHHALDRAVDRLYRKAPFATDSDRVALLFERYQALVG